MRRALTALGLGVLEAAALAQTTWHVDVNGVPPGNGTSSSPYTSIGHAIQQSTTQPGDTLLVLPGIYSEGLLPNLDFSLTIRSRDGPESTTIVGQLGVFYAGFAVQTIDGFTLVNPQGPAVWSDGSLNLFLKRCIVRDSDYGIIAGFNDIYLDRVTLVNNSVGVWGTPVESYLFLENTILWNNDSNHWGTTFFDYCAGRIPPAGGPITLGPGNIPSDPGFWNEEVGDYELKPTSPCIDAGNPASPPDPDGTTADIGALPFDAAHVPPPVVYCTAKTNSLGCGPSIGFSGGPASSTHAVPFLITATDVIDGTIGLLAFSTAGKASLPFLGGTLCFAPPREFTPVQVAGGTGVPPCTGTFGVDFNAVIQSGIHPQLAPGTFANAQYFYRDPQDPTAFGVGLTDAISFGIGI